MREHVGAFFFAVLKNHMHIQLNAVTRVNSIYVHVHLHSTDYSFNIKVFHAVLLLRFIRGILIILSSIC